jgi:hypothetical protein
MARDLPDAHTWTIKQLLFESLLDELDTVFSILETPYMPIKGAYLIRSGLANRLSQREMLDIDILVKPRDFPAVADRFARDPRSTPRKNHWPFENSFQFRVGKITGCVEIHHHLNYPERFLLPADELFSRARELSPGKSCMLPCPEDALLILVCHALVHIGFEIKSASIAEIQLISSLEGFSWERFWRQCERTGIADFARFLFSLTSPHFPLLNPRKSVYCAALSRMISPEHYQQMPKLLRRLIIEWPMMRNPVGFLWKRGILKQTTIDLPG